MTMTWNGMYVPALNVQMDLNEDGTNDVLFYQGTAPTPIPNVTFINVSATISGLPNAQRLSNNTFGEVTWLTNDYHEHGQKEIIIILYRYQI